MENIIIHRLDDTLGTDSSANTVIKWLTDIGSSFGSLSSLKFPLGSPSININDASGVIQVTSIDSTNATWYYYISGENAVNKKQIVSGDERYLYSATNSFYATLSGDITNKSTHIKFRYGIPNGGNDPIFSQNEIMIKQSFIDGTPAATKIADISNSTTDSYHFASLQDGSNITMTVQEFCLRYLSNTTYINPYAKYKLSSNALNVSNFGIMIRCDTISPTSSISGLQYATTDQPFIFIDVSYIADPFNTTACGLLLDSSATLRFNGNRNNSEYSFKFQLWNQYDLTPYTLTRQYDVEALFSQDEYLLPVIIKTYITPTRALSLTDPYYRFTSGVQSRSQGFTVNTLWSASGLSATKSTWGSQYLIVTQQNADICGSTAIWRVNRETWLNDVSSTQIFDLSTISLENAIQRGYRTNAILQGTDRIYLDVPDGGYTDNDTTAFPLLAFRIYDGRIGTAAAYSIGSNVSTSARVNIPPTVTSTARELFIVCPSGTPTDKLASISTADIFSAYGGEDKNKDTLKITITDISFGPILYTYIPGGNIDSAFVNNSANRIDISTVISISTEYNGTIQYTTTNNTSSYPYLKFKFVDDYGGESTELTGYVRIQAPPQFSLTDISTQRLRTIYNSTEITTGAISGDQIYNISGLLNRFFPNRTDSNGLTDICGIYIEDISASASFTVIRRVGESATSGTSIIRTDPNDVNRFCYMNDSVEFNYTGISTNEVATIGFRLFDSNIANISGLTSPGQGKSALSRQKNTFIVNSSTPSISISGNIIYGELPTTVLNLFENISNTIYNPPSFSVSQLLTTNISFGGIVLDGSSTEIYNNVGDTTFTSESIVSYNGNNLGKWQYSKSAVDVSWIDISATGDRGLLIRSESLIRFYGNLNATSYFSILQPYINFRPYTGTTDITAQTGDKLLDELYWSNSYTNFNKYSSITPNAIARIRAHIQPFLFNETQIPTDNYQYPLNTDVLSTLFIVNSTFPTTYDPKLYFRNNIIGTVTTDCSLNITSNISGFYITSMALIKYNISGDRFISNNNILSSSSSIINYNVLNEYFIRNITINTKSILSYSQPSIIFDFSGQYKIRNTFDISYQADLLPRGQYYSDISVNLGDIGYNIQKSYFTESGNSSPTFSFVNLFNAAFPDLSGQRDRYGIALYYEPPKYNAEGDPDICGTWIIKQSGFADISQITVLNSPTKYLLIGRDPSPPGTSDINPIEIQFVPIDPPILENNFTAKFKFRLWNRKVGAHRQVFDTSYNSGEERVGPGTPFSEELFTAYYNVTVNSRPTLVAPLYPLKLTDQYEDQPDHTILIYDISSIYATILSYSDEISISDDDFGENAYTQMGMVITDISSNNIGTWEFYRGSDSVASIPTLSGNFFHLRPNDRIRFNNTIVPNANNKNNENNSPYFTFRLWDQGNITTVISSGYITDSIRFDDPADNYSQNYITIRINVIPTNDIPIGNLTGGAVTMTTISSSNTDPSGITVQEMFGKFTTISDVDVSGTSSLGIAVYNVNVSYGEWQYKMTTGDSWTDLSNIYTLSGALLLGPDAALRFRSQVGIKPVGTRDRTLHFRIWDGTLGASGDIYNVQQFFNDADKAILDSSYNQPPFSEQQYNLNQPVDFINTRPTISLKLPDLNEQSLELTSVNIAEGGQLQIKCKDLISYLNISDIDILDGQYIGLACYGIDVCGADPSLDSTSIKISYVKNDNIISIPLRDKTQPDLSDLSINNAFHFRCDENLADSTQNNTYLLFEGSGSYFYGNIYMKFYSWDGYPLDITQPNNGPSLFETKTAITLSGGHPELSSYSINDAELRWGIDPVQNRPEISGTNTSYVFETLQTASSIDLSYIPIVNIINYFIDNGTYVERDPDDDRGISITSYFTSLVKKVNGASSTGTGIWQFTTDYTAESKIWNDINRESQTIYYNYLLTRDISAAIRFFPYSNTNVYDAYTYGTSELVMRLYDGTDISMIDGVLQSTESPYIQSLSGGSAFSASNIFINAIIHPVNHAPDLSFTSSTYTIKTYQADTSGTDISIGDIFGVLDAQNAYIESYDLCANFIKRGLYFYNFTNNISGQWYYSDTSGTSWSNAAASYHVPEASDNVRFRFEPAKYKFGDTAGSFSIYAWDTLSTLPDPTSVARGEGTSYSVSGATFSTMVTFMNHSPIIAESAPQDGSVQFTYNITDICEGSGPITISCSNIINALSLSTNYKEYDANQTLGIAIINKYDTSVNAYPSISGLGDWTYNTSSGDSFSTLNTKYISGLNTIYKLINIDSSASLQYTPNANANGRTTLQFLAWDKNTSKNAFSNDYILNDLSGYDSTIQGGNNSYSINRGEIILNILPVNTPAYFNLTDISYNAGTFSRGGDLSFVSVSGLITSFGFTDTDSTEYGTLAKRSLIVTDLCNNLAIGGSWLGISGDINGPSYEIISGSILNESDWIFYRSAAIVPTFPAVNNRGVSIFLAPYDGGAIIDICYSKTAFVYASITNVQPTISGDPLIYDLSSFVRLTIAPRFTVSEIYNYLYKNFSIIKFAGDISSIGIAFSDVSNSENILKLATGINNINRTQLCSVFIDKWEYKKPTDINSNRFNINKDSTGDESYNGVPYYNHTYLTQATEIFMTTPPTIPVTYTNITRNLYCYIYDICDSVPSFSDISYAIKISQTIKPPYNLSDIDPELAAVLRANSDYIGSTIENTTFIKGTELDYIYNSVGDGINSITATDNNQIPDLAYSQLLTPIIRTSETINYDNANSVRSITRTFTEIISKKKQT